MELAAMPAEKTNLNKTLPETDFDDGDEDAALPEQSVITLTLTPEFCGTRLDKVLSTLVPQYSRSRLQQWIEAGHVTVDGQPARAKTAMLGDEAIIMQPQAAPEDQAYQPEPMS